jgi:hypothetical protein
MVGDMMQQMPNSPDCSRKGDLITWLYGESSIDEASDFERHLTTCSICSEEASAFRGVRNSIYEWRQESLSGVTNNVPAFVDTRERKPSAMAAIREFFNLSPLWLKGAVALASVLFCILTVLAIARFRETPTPQLVNNPAPGSNSTVKEDGVNVAQQTPTPERTAPQVAPDNEPIKKRVVQEGSEKRSSNYAGAKEKQRPLSRQERQQLAVDLRLTSLDDETDLDLLERLNRQED